MKRRLEPGRFEGNLPGWPRPEIPPSDTVVQLKILACQALESWVRSLSMKAINSDIKFVSVQKNIPEKRAFE